jgi:hypothetical protein
MQSSLCLSLFYSGRFSCTPGCMQASAYLPSVAPRYGADRNAKWAHEVGPVTSMAFSLKGVSVAFVFFSTQTYSGKERSFPQQILFRCGWKSQSYSNFPEHLDEALMGDNGYVPARSSSLVLLKPLDFRRHVVELAVYFGVDPMREFWSRTFDLP